MTQRLVIHPENPQHRLIHQVVDVLQSGGVIVYPTDSAYAFGFAMGNKAAMDRVSQIRQIDSKHNYTLVCSHMSDIGNYVRLENSDFRLIKSCVPGPFTFILEATKEVPRRLMNQKRKTVGVRIPDSHIIRAILAELGEPLMSSSLIMPNQSEALSDPDDIYDSIAKHVDLLVDGGYCGNDFTTVIDCAHDAPTVIRQGKGDASMLDL